MARWTLALLAMLLGCGASDAPAPLQIAAAASLTDVLAPIAEDFERTTGRSVALRFGGSSTLARQIEDGAPADVFVSADPRWVDELVDHGLEGERSTFATNRLVVIVPAEADAVPSDAVPSVPSDLGSLARCEHLALAGEDVPAGAHARRALEREGLLELLSARIVSAPDVRAALAWVASGEARVGMVYATDARIEPRVRVALSVDVSAADPIVYEALALGGQDARAFVRYLESAEAQARLAAAGFGPP